MRYCRSALLLASSLGLALAQTPPDIPNFTGPLTLVLRSDSPVSRDILNAMQREVESLVEPSNIRITWTGDGSGQVYDRVAVIHLRGVCRTDSIGAVVRAFTGDTAPLGQTQVVDGKVLPFADVRCNPVRSLIARDLAGEPSYERDDLFGRALGRVLAHELYHILLRTTAHGTQGLARPAQSSADLIADRDNFAPADEQKLSRFYTADASASFDRK